MEWTRKRVEANQEKNIITGMIISDKYLKEIISILDIDLLQIPYVRTVVQWCFDYYQHYEKAPLDTINAILEQKSKFLDLDQFDLIKRFLTELSKEYVNTEFYNATYFLDETEKYLKIRSAEVFKEQLEIAIENEDSAKVENLIGSYKRIARVTSKGVDVFRDTQYLFQAFEGKENDELFSLPGKLGQVLGPLSRGEFFAILAPSKRGKSVWLIDLAIRAAKVGLKVEFISLEMTKEQMLRRIGQSILGETNKPKTIKMPYFDCKFNQSGECDLRCRKSKVSLMGDDRCILPYEEAPSDYVPCSVCRNKNKYKMTIFHKMIEKKGVDSVKAVKKAEALDKIFRGGRFHLTCFPSDNLTMTHLKVHLSNLEMYEGIVPDVLIVDYAAIMKSENYSDETRHQLDAKWTGLRGIAQSMNNLVITVHHSHKKTLTKKIKQGDSSESSSLDKHVTNEISLNQTDEEKEQGIMNVGVLFSRFENFNSSKEIIVLQSLDTMRPCLDSM
jgi:replicative DNA helicase